MLNSRASIRLRWLTAAFAVAGCALGLLAGCSDAGQPSLLEGVTPLPSEPTLRLSTLAGRLGTPSKAAIIALGGGYRVSATSTDGSLDLDLDASGTVLRVAVGARAIELQRVGAQAGWLRPEGDILHQASTGQGSSALFFARGDRVEELIHVPSAETAVGYDFDITPGLALRELPGSPATLEVADGRGSPFLRVGFPRAWDADGREWPIQLHLERAKVRLTLPHEARFPVVIDPSWSKATVRMSMARFRHSATLLLDGKVLLAGGATQVVDSSVGVGSSPTGRAELFDPALGTFEEVGKLVHARWGHTATLMRDGRVLIAGGVDEGDAVLASAELYDPANKSFKETGAMNQARALHTATLLADDRVLLLGGIDDPKAFDVPSPDPNPDIQVVVPKAESYRPGEGRFDDLGTAPNASFPHAAVLLSDGRVAIAWPQVVTPELRQGTVSLVYFDPQDNSFKDAGQGNCMSQSACGGILLHYEAGSPGDDPSSIDVVTRLDEIQLDPKTRNWTSQPNQPQAPQDTPLPFNVMTFDPSRGPLLVGRWLTLLGSSKETATWTRENSKNHEPCVAGTDDCIAFWSSSSADTQQIRNAAATPLAEARVWPSATSLVDGSILVAGGLGNSPLSSVEQRLAEVRSSQLLTSEPNSSPTPLGDAIGNGHAATLLGDGRVLFTGGDKPSKTARAWTVKHGSSLDTTPNAPEDVQDVGTTLVRRIGHQSFLLPSGHVLLAGGETPEQTNANEELFDPTSGKSRDLGFRLQARQSGLALSGNRYLFAGPAELDLVDATDFSVRRIELSEPLGCPAPGLARLLNGRVAVVGQGSVFELDPKQMKLSAPVALRTPRCDAAVAALPDGTLAIAGGRSQEDEEAASTAFEVYDSTRQVSTTKELATGVVGARALVRFSGLILLGLDSQSVVNWTSAAETTEISGRLPSPHQSITTLADGGILHAYQAPPSSPTLATAATPQYVDAAERIDVMPTDSTDLKLDGAPLEVTPGQLVPLDGVNLSKMWPENSGGTTQGSATNAPVAIWIPVLDGWPVIGTFSIRSEDRVAWRATWQVPHPAFPGLGVLGYVLSGTLHPLRLVRVKEVADSGSCVQSSECVSGYCVDSVCCDRACDSTCEACTAAHKAAGNDGVCGPTPADGSIHLACDDQEPKACGRTGLCDGNGKCALFLDGQTCADGFACKHGVCNQQTCITNNDCSDPFVCNSKHECQPPFGKPNTSIGCAPGCGLASRESPMFELWGLGLGLAVAASRRRSRRQRATSASRFDAPRRGGVRASWKR